MGTNRLLRYPVLVTGSSAEFNEALRLGRKLSGSVTAGTAGTSVVTVTGGTLGGYTAAQLLDRSNQTGPWYTTWRFRNENAGMVVRGKLTGALYRIYPDDEDAANVAARAEPVTALAVGDWLFAAGAGPVLPGIYQGGLHRWYVWDENPAAPQVGLERLASGAEPSTADGWFAAGGFTWLNKGRLTGRWFASHAWDQDAGTAAQPLVEEY